MMVKQYRKRPVVVEAVHFNGSSISAAAIETWMGNGGYHHPGIDTRDQRTITIPTLEGDMRAMPGDYIIKGIFGEFYPCKPDIFEATYEEVAAEFQPGDRVTKPSGYPFPGTVVAAFPKLDGEWRYVVESDPAPGLLHIFAGSQLKGLDR
ncbi:MAG: PGDYG domain-containing protein [Promicromonosporaceae bacterium]|nr:PGDYG domain-containing protein [Promicromonosporaceae bacterium]